MRFLLNSFFSSSWFLVIVLIAAMALLLFSSFSRRKKEEQYRQDLAEKLQKGVKVKTFGGVYGTIINVRNTTDGKIVLLETGEGDNKSYQQLHINAIFGIDDSEDMVIDSEGNEVPLSMLNAVEEAKKEEVKAEEKVEEKVEEKIEEPKQEEEKVEKPSEKKRTTKKTTKKD